MTWLARALSDGILQKYLLRFVGSFATGWERLAFWRYFSIRLAAEKRAADKELAVPVIM